jgi:hypothetical protein
VLYNGLQMVQQQSRHSSIINYPEAATCSGQAREVPTDQSIAGDSGSLRVGSYDTERMTCLVKGKIDSGARIFDLGKDALRQAPSDFYAAETKLMQSNGYVQEFVKYVIVNGEAQQLFQWVKPAV